MIQNSIDFVIPWVDPSDPHWQKELIKYQKEAGIYTDISDNRYRDWGLFKYWFRGVEKYAPWVNKIHLVTSGHYPDWLDLEHPKINFVKHEDFIPNEFLPTFSVNPIELNIHRITGLSERFVYFNDDIFIKAPLNKSWFFQDGLPCDAAILNAYSGAGFSRIRTNSNAIINKYYTKSESIRSKPLNWFNIKYGRRLIKTFLLLPWNQFLGLDDHHLANAYLKSTFDEIWRLEEDLLKETCVRKFRHDLDISQYLFKSWQLVNNNFKPISKDNLGDNRLIGQTPLAQIVRTIESQKKPLICLQDSIDESHSVQDIEIAMNELQKTFEKLFPNKSSFEL